MGEIYSFVAVVQSGNEYLEMFSVFLGLEDSTVENKTVQKMGRACSIQSKNV
jgi:hypothetical protein